MNLESCPNLKAVVDQISETSVFQKKSINRYIANADDRFFQFAETVVSRMIDVVDHVEADQKLKYIADTYLWYTKTIRLEELYFRKHSEYRLKSFKEAYEQVYSRKDYMVDYTVGLGMTQIFWGNHWGTFQFFLDKFLPTVKDGELGAELGVGHGLFHAEFLKACPNMKSKLCDISESSIATTKKMIKATGLDPDRATACLGDVQENIPIEDNSLDAVLMGEFIEHIEKGEEVMTEMSKKIKPTGHCYFSTAANAPAEDHILLFRTTKEIRDFVDKCGWNIKEEYVATLNNLSVEVSEKEGHNINYAAVITKK